MPDLLNPAKHDATSALGTFILAAIVHLTATDRCCPLCCPQCSALHWYCFTGEYPGVADIAIRAALDGQEPDWIFEGGINWPYLTQFWPAHDTSHTATCNR